MPAIHPTAFLRRVLLADAAASGAMGLLALLGAGELAEPLGLPPALMRWAGMGLLPFAASLVWLATRARLPRSAVQVVIIGNILWAAASILLLPAGWIAPTGLGLAFVLAQALAVAVLAEVEVLGLRRSAAA